MQKLKILHTRIAMLHPMAFTPQDLAAIGSAIASGELTVRANGREVTYRSMDDLLKARSAIAVTLAAQSTPTRPAGPRHLLASFSD